VNWHLLLTIARREMTEMTRDGRFRWAGAIVLGLLLVSLGMGWKHAREVGAQHQAAQHHTRHQWLHQGKKNPHLAAHFGIWVFKPRSVLSMADTGIEPYTGIAAKLEAHNRSEFKYRPARDTTAVGRFGQLSAALTLQVLVPLLIVLLCFGSFAGERETGTLRQVLALGVPRANLAWGKALGASGALSLLLLPAAVLGAVALGLNSTSSHQSGDMWVRAGLMALGYALYFGAFVGVSLGVSALASSSRTALLLLLGFWVANSLLVPRAAADMGRRLYPTPTQWEFTQATQREFKEGVKGGDTQKKREAALEARLLKQYRVKSIDKLPVDYVGVMLIEAEAYIDPIYDRHWKRIWAMHQRQNELQLWGALLAPLPAMRDFSMGMAGTDTASHQHLSLAAENYRRDFVRTLNVEWAYNSTEKMFLKNVRDRKTWERVPPFSYQPPRAVWALSQHLHALALLGAWFGVGVLVCSLGAYKMRVD
jgi:ABC-2 type transport system permease protein